MSMAVYVLLQFIFQAALGGFAFFTAVTLGILFGRMSWTIQE